MWHMSTRVYLIDVWGWVWVWFKGKEGEEKGKEIVWVFNVIVVITLEVNTGLVTILCAPERRPFLHQFLLSPL